MSGERESLFSTLAWGDAPDALERILAVVESDDSDEAKLSEIRSLAYVGLDRRPPWAP